MVEPTKRDKVFALFLPENEIHEIGLLYLNYEITLRGYKSIYLGQTMPIDSLVDLLKYYDNIHFVSYFTVSPTKDELHAYFDKFSKTLNISGNSKLWVLGHQIQYISESQLPMSVKAFNSVEHVISII